MTKTKKTVLKIVLPILVIAAAVLITLFFLWHPVGDTQDRYLEKVWTNANFANDIESAVPQTEIYNIIKDHFTSPLPEGKTEKKAIVLGYDGCRLDALKAIDDKEDGAINKLLNGGGKMVISYAGGVPYPQINTQDTSTAPGWCSMLTGVLADVHGITKNDVVKSNDHLTLLTTLVQDGLADSSAFYVSWKGHFSRENATYLDEVEYTKQQGVNANFVCSKNDKGTAAAITADVSAKDCTDFIFSTFEYCDHAGHQTGFYNSRYDNGFRNADKTAEEIIDTIYARESFDTEDWLIVITSDHGGIGRNHGGASIQERYTMIVVNKDIKIGE